MVNGEKRLYWFLIHSLGSLWRELLVDLVNWKVGGCGIDRKSIFPFFSLCCENDEGKYILGILGRTQGVVIEDLWLFS